MPTDNSPRNNFLVQVREQLIRLLNLGADKAPEEETIERIKAGVDFHGAKLWVLILAIFVASLGLNTNSAAVIIGAMLISPLMGPIMGLGLGLGINDFELFKRALRSFSVATLFSVLTATAYFLITPIAEAQSELLARTAPTIYDVLIALCGGLAGIIALSSIGQRGGNVIPGVAIATALMPPLCTTGFGIATGNWAYALGAFYLYAINTIFISLATFLGVSLLNFPKKVFVDKVRELRVKRIITAITVLTILPAILLTYGLVRETVFDDKANRFINSELTFDDTQIILRDVNYEAKYIKVILLGQEIDDDFIAEARKRLSRYGLEGTELEVLQTSNNVELQDMKKILQAQQSGQKLSDRNAELLATQQKRIQSLENELAPYNENNNLNPELSRELRTLFPQVEGITLCRGELPVADDSVTAGRGLTVALLQISGVLHAADETRLHSWLHQRIATDDSLMFVQIHAQREW